MPILFYSTKEVPYGCFSNFSAHPFTLDGAQWRTSEHYFQAMKFAGHLEHVEALRLMPSPMQVAKAGRSRARPLRADWEQVKDDVMRAALYAKFTQNPEIQTVLLETGHEEIIENTTNDHYWGIGSSGTGLNMLGKLLMELRERLRRTRGAGKMNTALERARASLEGLSVGDGFGEKFFFTHGVYEAINERSVPSSPWFWTDDTAMAISLYECLQIHGEIISDDLAQRFARRHRNDPMRGYGAGTRRLMNQINEGQPWQEARLALFDGRGSFGNGAAMRVAPLGAYFADDLERVVEQATLSAEITHAHPEGIAGAIAVAVAAALAVGHRHSSRSRREYLHLVAERVPESEVKSKIVRATKYTDHTPIETAISQLGVGWEITAQDTVPFCIWCAAKHLDDFVEAMWYTVSALGDRDTTCAIVGGIVAANVGVNSIPRTWRQAREELPVLE